MSFAARYARNINARSVAIVGAGLSGIAALASLVSEGDGQLPRDSEIFIYNSHKAFGPGSAYDLGYPPCFTINHECDLMGGLGLSRAKKRNADFITWAVANRDGEIITAYKNRWRARFPDYIKDMEAYLEKLSHADLDNLGQDIRKEFYLPRSLYGEYLQAAFKHYSTLARQNGIRITPRNAHVKDIEKTDSGNQYNVVYDAAVDSVSRPETDTVDAVALCVGHWEGPVPQKHVDRLNYFHTPYAKGMWEQENAKKFEGKKVAVLGTGLAAMDAAVAALEIGHAKQVVLVGRNGKLREVRANTDPHYQLKYLSLDVLEEDARQHGGFIRLQKVFELGRQEIEQNAYANATVLWDEVFSDAFSPKDPVAYLETRIAEAKSGPAPWRSFLDALGRPDPKKGDNIPIREHIYRRLSPEDKQLFMSKYYSTWLSFQAPMPLPTAEKLLGLMRADVPGEPGRHKVEVVKGSIEPHDNKFKVTHSDNLSFDDQGFDFMISTTGQHPSAKDVHPISALLDRRHAHHHDVGGIQADPHTFRVEGSDNIYAIGPIVMGEQFIINSLTLIDNARAMAGSITRSLGYGHPDAMGRDVPDIYH